MDINQFITSLQDKLKQFELNAAALQCETLIDFLLQGDQQIPVAKAEKILQQLRNKRMFTTMKKVAEAYYTIGLTSFKIQKQYAQSMIDSGEYVPAVFVLKSLIAATDNNQVTDLSAVTEKAEARGLIGRIYKQLYVNAGNAANPNCKQYISLAVNAYYQVYAADKTKTWHGINTVACLERAKRDQIDSRLKIDSLKLAKEILADIQELEDKKLADAWDYATAAEACVALNKTDEAVKWLSGYARMPDCDAFELASTLRQLEEVWQLNMDDPAGMLLLPILRAELMKRLGSEIVLDIKEIKKQQALEGIIDAKYSSLVENKNPVKHLEKVFDTDSFKTYKWYMLGAARALAVARIGLDSSKGFGTGFLLKGKDLKEDWGEELVLITNAHVVSNDPAEQAMRPEEAIVIFEAIDNTKEFRDFEILFSSPSTELDATILKFSKDSLNDLTELTKGLKFYPVSKYLPAIETPPTQKAYIIGHPFGGTLQISFQDNLVIDHDNSSKIHYRTPTEGGNSGSPVFNQQWDLIGLHHAGSEEMPCLNGKPGTYEANEGIWIQAIRKKITS